MSLTLLLADQRSACQQLSVMAADRAASGIGSMALEPASSTGSQGSAAAGGAGGGMIGSWRTAFRAASDAVVGLPPREVRTTLTCCQGCRWMPAEDVSPDCDMRALS